MCFQAHMKFPPDYPYSPPSIRFLTKVWHPNVYEVRSAPILILLCLKYLLWLNYCIIVFHRMEICAFQSFILQLMTLRVGNYHVKDGTLHRMSGKAPRVHVSICLFTVVKVCILIISFCLFQDYSVISYITFKWTQYIKSCKRGCFSYVSSI